MRRKIVALEPDGLTRAVAAFIAKVVVMGDGPDWLNGAIVGAYARAFVEAGDEERWFPAPTIDDLPEQLAKAARAPVVWEKYVEFRARQGG